MKLTTKRVQFIVLIFILMMVLAACAPVQAFFEGYTPNDLIGFLIVVLFFFKPGFSIIEFFKGLAVKAGLKIQDSWMVLFTQIVVGFVVFLIMLATNALNFTDFVFNLKNLVGTGVAVWAVAQYAWQRLKTT